MRKDNINFYIAILILCAIVFSFLTIFGLTYKDNHNLLITKQGKQPAGHEKSPASSARLFRSPEQNRTAI